MGVFITFLLRLNDLSLSPLFQQVKIEGPRVEDPMSDVEKQPPH